MIGLFREPVTIMKATQVQSASGSTVLSWVDEKTIYCKFESLNFDKQVIANNGTGSRLVRVNTWYLEDLTGLQEELGQTYRLKRTRNNRDYYYEIFSVQEIEGDGLTYMFMELTCSLIDQRVIQAPEEGIGLWVIGSTFTIT